MNKPILSWVERHNVMWLIWIVPKTFFMFVRSKLLIMNFELLSFVPSSPDSPATITIRFKPSFVRRLFGKRAFVSVFVSNGRDWFEIQSNGAQFKCDDETSKFLTLQLAELENAFKDPDLAQLN
jgi:hypothetical protein